MKHKELSLEDILEEEEVVLDIKQNPNSELSPFFTQEIVRKLIDYSTKIPIIDNTSIGHKYPFNACELLSSDNSAIMDILLNEITSSNQKHDKGKESVIINHSDHNANDLNDKNDISSSTEYDSLYKTDEIKGLYSQIAEINKLNQIAGVSYDNLDYLFSFLDLYKPEDANFVLLGYFSQIFSHLLDSRGETLISYIFTSTKEVLFKLLYLIKYKSISDCICQIFTFTYDDNIIPMHEYKAVLLKCLLTMLKTNESNDIYESICDLISLALSDIEMRMFLVKEESFINYMAELIALSTSSDYHLRAFMKVIITLNEIIINGFEKKVTMDFFKESQDNTQQLIGFGLGIKFNAIAIKTNDKMNKEMIAESNLRIIIDIMKQNGLVYMKEISNSQQEIFIPENKVTYNMPQEVLGLTRIVLMKYLRTIMDIFINAYANNFLAKELDSLIPFFAEKKIFENTINYFFRFQFNNIYQTLFLEIMSIVTNEYSPKVLIDEYFVKLKFLDLIIAFVEKEPKFLYKSKRVIFNGCFGAIVELSKMIFDSKNKHLKQILKGNKDFCTLYYILLGEANKQYNCTSIIETLKHKKKEDSRSRIHKIDTEEKIPVTNRFAASQMFAKEMNLFHLYKEGKDYSKDLVEFRNAKIIQETELSKLKPNSPSKRVNIFGVVKTNEEFDGKEKDSKKYSINQYYDNSYWSIYSNNFNDQ